MSERPSGVPCFGGAVPEPENAQPDQPGDFQPQPSAKRNNWIDVVVGAHTKRITIAGTKPTNVNGSV
ncbi:MAG: hypothetical protein MZV65_28185 [Chromatiales bacterium]|nr:hypothetical protein [Chromatiales bacterium]